MALTREQFQSLRAKGLSVEQIVKFESGEKPNTDVKLNTSQKLGNVLLGAGKGVLNTALGVSSLGSKALQTLMPSKALGDSNTKTSADYIKDTGISTPTNNYQKAGFFGEQVAEFAVPATKLAKAEKGLSLGTKLLSRAVTSGAVASVQEGKIGKGSAIAAGTELALPVIGKAIKPATQIISRLFTGLGSGLSGVSSNTLKTIYDNPKVAQDISKKILNEGQESILESNAKTILEGVSKIRKEARNMYGKGIETLSKTDIKPEVLKNNLSSLLNKNGIIATENGLDLSGSEILSSPIQQRAKNLILELNDKVGASGKDIRTFMDKLQSSKFKSSLDPDRKAFNNLISDITTGLKKSINESTDKLKEIDSKYSKEMSLAEGVQNIFGKVNFKNTTELNRVAKKLEGLFSQKGLDPKTVDNFLTRIGSSPSKFKTSEAVRNIATKATGANTKGLSIGEITQQITSSIVTPSMVKNIAIYSGVGESIIKSIIKNTSPTARAAIIKSLINENKKTAN